MSKYIVKAKNTSLKAPLTATASSVVLRSLKDIKDNNIDLSSIGDWGVIVIKQGDNVEMIKIDDISYASDGTATCSVATNGRYLDPTTPYAGSSTGLSFQSGAEVIMTNDPLTVTQFANLNLAHTWSQLQTFSVIPILPASNPTSDNQAVRKKYSDELDATNVHKTGNETVAGIKTFSSSPIVPTPTTDYQSSTKKYVDDIAIAGAPDASDSVKGIVEIATDDELLNGDDVGSTGAKLVPRASSLKNKVSYECAEDIDAGDLVSLNDTNKIIKASSAQFDERIGVLGFATETKLLGEDCVVDKSEIYKTTGLTAGEDYYMSDTLGEIRTISPDNVLVSNLTDTTTLAYTQTDWKAQAFTTSNDVARIKKIKVKSGGAVTSNQEIWSIRSSLTGADLWSVSQNTTNGVDVKTLSPNLAVSPNTTYYLVVRAGGSDLDIATDNTTTFETVHSSTDSGASWSSDSGYRWYMEVTETTDPFIKRWVGKALSTTLLDRELSSREYVSDYLSYGSSSASPTNGNAVRSSTSNGTVSVAGRSISTAGGCSFPVQKGDAFSGFNYFRIKQ